VIVGQARRISPQKTRDHHDAPARLVTEIWMMANDAELAGYEFP
jgi:hypothetical protein